MAQAQHHKHERNLIVVGESLSGKRLILSLLLGQENPQHDKKTAKHNIHVRGQKFTVVETPGWWKGYPLIDTAERIKHELQLSVRLCPPGPHTFILTVEIGTFTETNRTSIEEHLGLFGENVWGHTIVVFTKGESLKGLSIEQHIETQGEALKWVLEKCGNRYCVYDNQAEDQNQVIQLLEQIDSVGDNNSGRHFELDETTLREVEEKKRVAQERAKARQLNVEDKRKRLKEGGPIQPLSEVRIVMLGWVTCGKSYAKNVILDKKDVPPSRTHQCEKHTGPVGDRYVTVVDTPGWWKYFSAQYTPDWVKRELQQSVTFGSNAPHALLLVVPADVSFLEEQRKVIQENMKIFGEMIWRHTIVLFTWGDSLGNMSIEEHIESEGGPLRWLVEKCGNRYHVFNIMNGGDGSQVHQLLEKIEEMEASISSCDGTQKLPEMEVTESYRVEKEVRKEIMEFLDNEWNRRDNELEEKVRAMCRETRRGDKSMDNSPEFSAQENEVSVDTTGLSIKCPSSSEKPEQAEHEPPEQTERNIQEMFRRELARREAVIIEKFQGIISEHIRSGVAPSEPDDHDIKEATKKVLNWRTSSGIGSELEEGDNGSAEGQTY